MYLLNLCKCIHIYYLSNIEYGAACVKVWIELLEIGQQNEQTC